jgi:hypothetical protein
MTQQETSLRPLAAVAATLGLMLLLHSVHASEPTAVRAPLVAKLEAIAGDGARDCGTYPPYSRDVLSCAQDAIEKGERFWFIQEVEGVDTIVARGIASDGKTVWIQRSWEMFRGQPVQEPHFTEIEECHQPTVELGQHPGFRCSAGELTPQVQRPE